MERAGKVAGARFFYLKNDIAMLDMALMHFALEELQNRGYTPVVPPYMMKHDAYEGVTALGDFEEVLYKIEGEDLYMIATSEHPLAAMYWNEVLKQDDLPIKLAGITHASEKRQAHTAKTHAASSAPTNSTKSSNSYSANQKTPQNSMRNF
jgi:seryl-tRNA synthetase